MKFSIHNFRPCYNMGSLAATADVFFGNSEIVIHEVKLIHSRQIPNGLFLAMPSVKRGDAYVNTADIINDETRLQVTKKMIEMYHKASAPTNERRYLP